MMKDSGQPDRRSHARLSVQSKVRVSHDSFGQFDVLTANLSDGGLFLKTVHHDGLKEGDIVMLQSLDMAADAPVLPAKVLRINQDGFAVIFIDASD